MAAVRALVVGDPADEDVDVGPVIDELAREDTLHAARDALAQGAGTLVEGVALDGAGWYLTPSVVEVSGRQKSFERQEVFGPICSLRVASDDREALRLANDSPFGLVSAVHTRDLGRAMWYVDRLEIGLARVNAPTTGVDFHAPFGGDKGSGIGPSEQGRAARESSSRPGRQPW